MKRTYTLLAATALVLAAGPALAINLDGSADEDQSILNDHGNAGYVGTSFAMGHAAERGQGDSYGSIVLDVMAGNAPSGTGVERGQGDNYGHILNDLGSR